MSEEIILYYILLGIIFLLSIWFHEYAHAVTSDQLWDPTPRLQWRLTPNPFAHIDIFWFLLIFLIHFGWWKPVEVNPAYYKNPLKWELIVSLAGPFSNFIMAFIGGIFWAIFIKTNMINSVLEIFFTLFIQINVILAVFNLIPIPPLDWYRIIKFLWPSVWHKMEKNMLFFYLLLLILIFSWAIQPIIVNTAEFFTSLILFIVQILIK